MNNYYVFKKHFFVFHPSFSVTDSMFLTPCLVSAYITENILYNEGVKSKRDDQNEHKKQDLAKSIEIERGGGKV